MGSISSDVSDAPTAELVAGVAALAAELAARSAPESGAACYEQVDMLGQAVDLIESAIAARVAVADRTGQVAEWGHTSPTAWLRSTLGMRNVRAEERATLAAQLPRLPHVAKRLATGDLSAGYAAAVAAGVRRLDDADCGKAEDLLLGLIDDGHSVGQITRFTDKIKDLIAERDGTAAEPEDGRRAERQWWAIHRSGTGAFSKGRFGPELLALIKSKLEPLARPCGPEDTRDHAERLADALHTYLSGGDSRWDPILIIELNQPLWRPRNQDDQDDQGNTRPDSATRAFSSEGAPGQTSSNTPWAFQPPTPGWPCDGTPFTARLADGTPIPVQRARQILLNAGFSALVLGTDSQPLYLGRRVRCATPAQRRVLLARYSTCVVHGCEIPAGLCQIDHVDGWDNGQPTDVDRLVPCCAWHNRYKWQRPDRVHIARHDDGRYRYKITRPGDLQHDRHPGHNSARRPPERGP